MKTVFLYAGQGSQKIGMGKDLYEAYPKYRETIDVVLGEEYKSLMHEGELEVLSKTENTQPCMAAFAAGVTAVLKNNGIVPDATAGLSLGEYGALHVAGVMDAKSYVNITAFRGKAMAEAAEGKTCSMSAILGIQSAQVEEACELAMKKLQTTDEEGATQGNKDKFVALVNYNCPGQYVICGDEAAVAEAESILKEMGMKRSIRLNVSGPFHTPYMAPAAKKLGAFLAEVDFAKPQLPVVLNVTGDYYDGQSDIKANLCAQIQNGVHFEESVTRLMEDGADTFVEIGPGNTLSGFVKKTAKALGKEVTVYTIDNAENLAAVIEALA
ncbi:MAG: ACP S-malonyltransferase [Agathobacter sp.]|nr:ACP S-malonyltransferase [Agathobacter sp.]